MRSPKTKSAERAGDCHIHRQTTTPRPQRKSDIPRTTTRSGTQDVLLHDRVEKTFFTEPVDQVADAVVSHDNIPVPCAASGVIAENINDLLAQGTNVPGDTTSTPRREVVGIHDSVRPVEVRRDGRQESPSMRFCDTEKTLTLPSVRGPIHQRLVDAPIDPKGSVLLGSKGSDNGGGHEP